jgi:pimeloyl-ACP methyl ester carboxylesterase
MTYRTWIAALVAALALAPGASAGVGTSCPAGFDVPTDASLGVPVLGFGARGPIARTPVIFLHGNNDTPYPTACNPFYGRIRSVADYFLARGYAPGELWGLGYQGDQCDLFGAPTNRSGEAHSTVANVPDLRRFVHAVLEFTGAKRVDIVAHSLGVTLAREWMRRDADFFTVRRFVAIDGPNHGIVNCSPSPLNYWQLPSLGGFTPDSAICREYGAPDTPFLAALNRGREARGRTHYLVVRNADTSFVYFSTQDGVIAPVPAEDRLGRPHDFSQSARIKGAPSVDLTGQGRFDDLLGTAHLGILNSPQTWEIAFEFVSAAKLFTP